jgi:hypothetical protein
VKRGISIGSGFKIDAQGRVVKDHAASEAKLNVSLRLKRRNSQKVRPVRRTKS